MPRILEKRERSLGEKLFLKGERCAGPKCVMVRRSYAPGAHGKRKRRSSSEYGSLLKEKQKVRFLYAIDDAAIRRYSREASSKKGVFSVPFWQMLESRLDTLVYRLGFSPSRRAAQQAITHGHILVNGKTVTIPSYRTRRSDEVSLKERARALGAFAGLEERLKKHQVPSWLELDAGRFAGKVLRAPDVDEISAMFDATKIKEFYSR